jgi:hypothetical protein
MLFLGSGSTFGSKLSTNLRRSILSRHCRSFDRSRATEGQDSRSFRQPNAAIGFPLGLWRDSVVHQPRRKDSRTLCRRSQAGRGFLLTWGRQFSEFRSPYRVRIVGRRYEWRQEPARKAGGQRVAAGVSSAILGREADLRHLSRCGPVARLWACSTQVPARPSECVRSWRSRTRSPHSAAPVAA